MGVLCSCLCALCTYVRMHICNVNVFVWMHVYVYVGVGVERCVMFVFVCLFFSIMYIQHLKLPYQCTATFKNKWNNVPTSSKLVREAVENRWNVSLILQLYTDHFHTYTHTRAALDWGRHTRTLHVWAYIAPLTCIHMYWQFTYIYTHTSSAGLRSTHSYVTYESITATYQYHLK